MKKFTPIEKLSAAEQVVAQLRNLIFSGEIKPGDKLPPERELADSLHVNRTTLRMAFKKLEQLKLIFIRQGSGVEVLDYMRSPALELLGDLLTNEGVLNGKLMVNILEARLLIGREVIFLAANKRSAKDIKDAEKIIEQMKETPESPENLQKLDFLFFEVMARSADNMVYMFMINAIRDIYFANISHFKQLLPASVALLKNHEEILNAVNAKDGVKAAHLAEEYLSFGNKAMVSELKRYENKNFSS